MTHKCGCLETEQNILSNNFSTFLHFSTFNASRDTEEIELENIHNVHVFTHLILISQIFQVSWIAKVSEDSAETDDVILSTQLEKTAGTAICPGRQAYCIFNLTLINDDVSHKVLTQFCGSEEQTDDEKRS